MQRMGVLCSDNKYGSEWVAACAFGTGVLVRSSTSTMLFHPFSDLQPLR